MKKRVRRNKKTYIGALLALELGNGLLGRASIESHLIKTIMVSQLNICDYRSRGDWYLRDGSNKAGSHTGEPQGLASSREVPSSEHLDVGDEVKIEGGGEKGRRRRGERIKSLGAAPIRPGLRPHWWFDVPPGRVHYPPHSPGS
jgi:hypothetical protein